MGAATTHMINIIALQINPTIYLKNTVNVNGAKHKSLKASVDVVNAQRVSSFPDKLYNR